MNRSKKLFGLLLLCGIIACQTKVKSQGLALPELSQSPFSKRTPGTARQRTIITITSQDLFYKIQAKQDFILLDVRDEREYKEGHIEGAKLIPWNKLRTRYKELDPKKEIVVYCCCGDRSKNAGTILIHYGFDRIFTLGGGMLDWQQNNYPVIKEM